MDGSKIISMNEAVSMIKSGSNLMIGGFAGSEAPNEIIQGIVKEGIKDLTLICNDTGDLNIPGEHVGILTPNHCIKKAIVSHIGMNKFTVDQFNKGEIEVEFVPQGTLVERIRAGGFGLGGVLTPTGIGTDIAEGKEIINVDGKDYLLEKPLRADVCIVRARKADKMGNVIFFGSATSHSAMMTTAADITIVQADEIVENGEIEPNDVKIPGIFIDYIVKGGGDDGIK